jgi:exopolysaccharide/PEP-CTERM locus tyrosine autokinase
MVSIRDLALEGIISADSERSRAAEEYRMIKRPLLTRAFSGRPQGAVHQNLIMITSSVEGEGKTFSSLNLAISIAMEMDRTVLLVDADLAKPGLSRLLRINDRPGLTDRLIDESIDLSEVLLPTDIPKFNILPAGRRHRRSTELLSSSTMRRLLDELALRYSDRVVLFDSPPLLATSEASALAQQMGQICLVVESAVTPQFLVKDALARLENTENVSLVLNKCKPDLFLGRYGYGYGYQYGYGYGYGYGQNDK